MKPRNQPFPILATLAGLALGYTEMKSHCAPRPASSLPAITLLTLLALLSIGLVGPASAQDYVFDTGDTEYAYSMGPAHIPGELAMLQGFDAQGPGGFDVLAQVQAAVGTATQPAGALDGLLIVIAVWNDPTDDYDPTDAELLYRSQPVPVVQSNTDVKIPYDLPGVQVHGVFFIGAVIQDLGTFPAGADIDVPFVGHPVAWLVGEGPGAPLDLQDLSIASYPPLAMSEGFLLSATGGAPGPGTSYCVAAPNSTGGAAQISSGGSASITASYFALFSSPVPANQNGIFFYGPQQTQVPFGNGFLCVGPGVTGIARLPVVQADAFETMAHQVDLTAPPTAATQITAGSTWNFQAWFRDPVAGGAFFDLSDGLSVTFVP